MADTLPCCCAPPLSVEMLRHNESRSQALPAEEALSAGDNATAG